MHSLDADTICVSVAKSRKVDSSKPGYIVTICLYGVEFQHLHRMREHSDSMVRRTESGSINSFLATNALSSDIYGRPQDHSQSCLKPGWLQPASTYLMDSTEGGTPQSIPRHHSRFSVVHPSSCWWLTYALIRQRAASTNPNPNRLPK